MCFDDDGAMLRRIVVSGLYVVAYVPERDIGGMVIPCLLGRDFIGGNLPMRDFDSGVYRENPPDPDARTNHGPPECKFFGSSHVAGSVTSRCEVTQEHPAAQVRVDPPSLKE